MPRQEAVSQKAAPPRGESAPKKPVDKFREGPVHVSIWENHGINGAFRTASFEIRYRKGDEWQTSLSYGLSELPCLEIAANQARTRIEQWRRDINSSQPKTS